jgi:hypothetical protein
METNSKQLLIQRILNFKGVNTLSDNKTSNVCGSQCGNGSCSCMEGDCGECLHLKECTSNCEPQESQCRVDV